MALHLVREESDAHVAAVAAVAIVSEHPMLAALLGALVELTRHSAAFPRPAERLDSAMRRIRPVAVLLDWSHTAAGDTATYRVAAERGIPIILFGHRLDRATLLARAATFGTPALELPAERETIETILESAGEVGRGR